MNHEKFITQSIQSFINQSYENMELLYLDNCSNDKTFEKAIRLMQCSRRIFIAEKRTKCYSLSENLNYLVGKSNGEYLCVISCDDWMHENNVLEKIIFLMKNPVYSVVYSNGYMFNNQTKEFSPIYLTGEKSDVDFDGLLIKNKLIAVGNVIKKDILYKVGLFDEKSKIEDWDLWIRISKDYEIGYLGKFLVYYRFFNNNVSLNQEYMWEGYKYIFAKYKNEIDDSKNRDKILDAYHSRHKSYVNYLSEGNPSFSSFIKLLKTPKLKTYYFKGCAMWFLMVLFSKKRLLFKKKIIRIG
jgi:alpha-1,3-rhamnosyltransferase